MAVKHLLVPFVNNYIYTMLIHTESTSEKVNGFFLLLLLLVNILQTVEEQKFE